MNAREWLDEYARRLDVPAPSAQELREILDLAAEAAHGSERIAAPVACWLTARAGLGLAEAIELARQVSSSDPPAPGRPGAG